MRVVHEHVAGFEARNFFLDLVVGLSAAAKRVEKIVARTAAQERSVAPADEHLFDLFALGVISFSRNLLRHLEAVEPVKAAPPRAEDARVRDLLL